MTNEQYKEYQLSCLADPEMCLTNQLQIAEDLFSEMSHSRDEVDRLVDHLPKKAEFNSIRGRLATARKYCGFKTRGKWEELGRETVGKAHHCVTFDNNISTDIPMWHFSQTKNLTSK